MIFGDHKIAVLHTMATDWFTMIVG